MKDSLQGCSALIWGILMSQHKGALSGVKESEQSGEEIIASCPPALRHPGHGFVRANNAMKCDKVN